MTFLAKIGFEYEAKQMLGKEDKAELKAAVLARFGADALGWSASNIIGDEADCQWLSDNAIPFQISRFKGLTGGSGPGTMVERIKHVTQIAVPNVGLLAIDEVYLLADACTDDLQGHLNDGWRLLAICPPNSARRPDYILGRTRDAAA